MPHLERQVYGFWAERPGLQNDRLKKFIDLCREIPVDQFQPLSYL